MLTCGDMRLSVAVAVALSLVAGVASAAHARVRVTIPDFQLEGGAPPALALQLQDGFVLGLVRAGAQVIDPTDTAQKLEGHPELQNCDSSPCLKAIGQLLNVGYLLRVKVEVAGNSYKGVARLFSTEGAAPAALPIATESKSCDVCTVAEARGTMLKLADAVRSHIDEPPPPPAPAPPAPPPPSPPRLLGPVAVAMAGALAVAAGAVVLAGNGGCTGTSCSEGRARNAMGGVLVGAGAALAITGTYVTVVRLRGVDPVTGVAIGWRW
jgi:hypothetical protein